MSAFKGAVDVGAHAIETDLHLTKDGVVVLSHVRFFFPAKWSQTWVKLIKYRMLLSNAVLERMRSLWTATGIISRRCAR